jgi:hypothetical protein
MEAFAIKARHPHLLYLSTSHLRSVIDLLMRRFAHPHLGGQIRCPSAMLH